MAIQIQHNTTYTSSPICDRQQRGTTRSARQISIPTQKTTLPVLHPPEGPSAVEMPLPGLDEDPPARI
ncbi:hypothetical protein IF1G_00923 [Cordyceps javanica]|uniref:Uncharacterized protein n=1 Tax=Cordyceps javanica TaxID=43265 RepID=A0A545VH01_9HYPO|nr:hypothetical protein IF1G_00923 [Cordyceps javanica]